MVGYRENDLDDATDMDGLMAKAEPVSMETIAHPPRIIQSYILHTVTSPSLSMHDVALSLTCEYSILFIAKGISLHEFHFSEILESIISEEEQEDIAIKQQSPHQHPKNTVTMNINDIANILVVITQGKCLVLTLDLDYIVNNISYFSTDEASDLLHLQQTHPDDDTLQCNGFDYNLCVKGSIIIDVSDWMLLAPDPTTMSSHIGHIGEPMFQGVAESVSVWIPYLHEGGGLPENKMNLDVKTCFFEG